MPATLAMPADLSIRRSASPLVVLFAATAFLAGCATAAAPATPQQRSDTAKALPDGLIPVVRYGRYTLAELTADAPQRALMQQVIEITIPATPNATVADAMRYVLLRSGYQLCDDSAEVRRLEVLPLPAAHVHLGPVMLHEALMLLVGGTGELQIDDTSRRVCFMAQKAASDEDAIPRAVDLPESRP